MLRRAITMLGTASALALVAAIIAPSTGSPLGAGRADAASASSSAACSTPTVTVSTASGLQKALDAAKAGTVIRLASGTYSGRFTATARGTATKPIALCGTASAVLDAGDTSKGYVLHLDGAAYWRLQGFSVRHGQKGVVLDGTSHSTIASLAVSEIGDEGIHLRAFSSDNRVVGCTISSTGLSKPQFGEGIYIGTAHSNWASITDGHTDRSDRNVIASNRISDTTAESVDIKEGTTGGSLIGNHFDGAGTTAADSWVDVKGNGWTVRGNFGLHAPEDGFQTHSVVNGWGTRTTFADNHAGVMSSGYGFALAPVLANIVMCSNTAGGAAKGLTNATCRS